MFYKVKLKLMFVIILSCLSVYVVAFGVSHQNNLKLMNENINQTLNVAYKADLQTSASDISLYKNTTVFLERNDEVLTYTDSYLKSDLDKICESIIKEANNKNRGRVTVDGLKIAYAKKTVYLNLETNYPFINYYDYIMNSHEYDEYIFLDYTDKFNSFVSYQESLLKAGLITFILIIAVAYFISSYVLIPVEKSYKREMQLLGDVTHELKTPVAIISSNIETIENKGDELVKNQKKWLKNIKSQTTRMNYLIKDLLNFSTYRNKTRKHNIASCDISRVLEKMVLSYEQYAYVNDIKIESSIDEEIEGPYLKEDMTKLFSIFIDNAIKYNKKKGYIKINLSENNKKIYFSIINSGIGIEPDKKEKIFDRFYRADYARTQENENSFGLGLSIAKSIVDFYKGTIIVKSEIDKETEFQVVLKK